MKPPIVPGLTSPLVHVGHYGGFEFKIQEDARFFIRCAPGPWTEQPWVTGSRWWLIFGEPAVPAKPKTFLGIVKARIRGGDFEDLKKQALEKEKRCE